MGEGRSTAGRRVPAGMPIQTFGTVPCVVIEREGKMGERENAESFGIVSIVSFSGEKLFKGGRVRKVLRGSVQRDKAV